MIFYIIFDLSMAVIMFLFGIGFYKSEGKAVRFLTGYNMKSIDERKEYDENAMCKAYGRRMIFMSFPFLVEIIIDICWQGIGCLIAWGIWFIMFVLLLISTALSFVTIFLYKKRMLQIRLTVFSSIVLVGYYITCAVFAVSTLSAYGSFTPSWSVCLPFVCIILNWLAIRAIGKDEVLVRAYNTIR